MLSTIAALLIVLLGNALPVIQAHKPQPAPATAQWEPAQVEALDH